MDKMKKILAVLVIIAIAVDVTLAITNREEV